MLNRVVPALALCLVSGAVLAQEQRCGLPSPGMEVEARHYAVDRAGSPVLLATATSNPACPSADPACILPDGYQVTVPEVMGIFTLGDYACVLYILPDDPWGLPYRVGFLPASILTPLPAGKLGWSGTWTSIHPPTTITLTDTPDGAVHIEGVAANVEKTPGNVTKNLYREDVISEDVVPRKYTLAFEQTAEDIAPPYQGEFEDCPVRLWRAGAYVLISDNPYCGAPDVSFSGLYMRQ